MKKGLRSREWKRFVQGPDRSLLEELYVPGLSEAVTYDRCCAYFSSSVLAAAARGFGNLIQRLDAMGAEAPRPAVRLVVNEELDAGDVAALMEKGDAGPLEALLSKRFKTPADLLAKQRLALLGWLVKAGLLKVRVGVMRSGAGILHAKFGIFRDSLKQAVVFAGSGNESAPAVIGNYEQFEISESWTDTVRCDWYQGEFDALWAGEHAAVHTVPLPEALRLKLVKFAPKERPHTEPSDAVARQKAAMTWRLIVDAPFFPEGGATCDATALVDLWPHQIRVVAEAAAAWPNGRLLCDEVGMGKTVEAILVLRRLLAGRGVRRALLLLPAGLLKQWQGELREKGGLLIPRLEGVSRLVWPDGRERKVAGIKEALQQDILLMSRETARTENNRPILLAAEPWDVVLLDEAHAARRAKQEEGEFNSGTLLLDLLRQLQLGGKARGFLFLSATPMQTHPWEPWDLLSVLGEGGAWLSEFAAVRDFYEAAKFVDKRGCPKELALRVATLISSDSTFPPPPSALGPLSSASAVATKLQFTTPTQRPDLAAWLRAGSPLTRRMHRNTRETLRHYFRQGLLPDRPPVRSVNDVLFDYQDQAERNVYDAVRSYVERRFTELEAEKSGKGFVMTIYRRRASSSPLALRRSLERRADGLRRVAKALPADVELSSKEELDSRDLDDAGSADKVSAAFPSSPPQALAELRDVEALLEQVEGLRAKDSKRDCFIEILKTLTDDGRAVLVFSEYTDTVEYLRDYLVDKYSKGLGCYTGDGGLIWDGSPWKAVSKDVITRMLRDGHLNVLLCTDAASEGLNLQAAGAVVNYDLPWNPSKVEQRIGRIDRIGQKLRDVRVANLFLKDSVDEKVYGVLRQRCALFEHFVGPMQPVLSRARRMLLGQEALNLTALKNTADEIDADGIARETYLESEAVPPPTLAPAFSRESVFEALKSLPPEAGYKVASLKGAPLLRVSGPGLQKATFSLAPEELEADPAIRPISPFDEVLRTLATKLERNGECLPLVVGAAERGAFRSVSAYWALDDGLVEIRTLEELQGRLKNWDGRPISPSRWVQLQSQAAKNAAASVTALVESAAGAEMAARSRQLSAAQERLLREVGRYLASVDPRLADPNSVFSGQMARETQDAHWLQEAHGKLDGFPTWPDELLRELRRFGEQLTQSQRQNRLTGTQLRAALDDPRWQTVP